MSGKTRKTLNLLLIFGTLAIVLLVGVNGDEISQAPAALKAIGPKWILLCLLFYLLYLFMDAMSIWYFLRRQGYRIKIRTTLYIAIIGAYYCNITPGAAGGQPMQIFNLKKRGIPIGISTSALTVRMFSFQFMLAVIGTYLWIRYGSFIHAQTGSNNWMLIMGYVYNTFVVAMLLLIAVSKRIVVFFMGIIIRIGAKLRLIKDPESTAGKWNDGFETFHASVMMVTRHPLDLLVQFLIAGLQLIFLMCVTVSVYHAFGLSGVGNMEIIAMAVMLYMSAAYTPLPGASGAQEGIFALYFGNIFPGNVRFMALLLWRFFTYYMTLIIGAVVTIGGGFGKTRKVDKFEADGAAAEAANEAV